VLPFTKRPARTDSPELINTGDIEVVKAPDAKRPSAFPKPSSRPRAFSRSASDEEMTTLLPRKGMTFSLRPGAPVTPVPMPKRISTNPPRAQLEEPPTRQFVRPSAPPPSISPVAGPPRSSNRPVAATTRAANLVHQRAALRPQPVPVIEDDRKSDPRIDPPATVITARTRVVAARPTISWAAALVTMGVFVGLVTAVVARGDADTLIDAAASFVDPSGSHSAASGSGSDTMAVHTKASETHSHVVATADTLLAPDTAATDARVAWEQQSAVPTPPRPAPVAYAAPVVHHSARPAPRPAPAAHEAREAREEKVAAVAKPAPAPKAAASAPAAKAAKANDDDMESASAADALAKAQLEASLR
jgi:hypothetical protein